jgi:hypothetical protein
MFSFGDMEVNNLLTPLTDYRHGIMNYRTKSMASNQPKRAADMPLIEPQYNSLKMDKKSSGTDVPDVLCELCEKVDFIAYFTSKHNQTTLGPLSHVFDCPFCPMCQLIAPNVQKSYNPKSILRFKQVEMSDDEYIRDDAMERSFQLEVWSNRPRKRIISLDICEGLQEPRYPNARTCRVPINEKFELYLLFRWLEDSTKKTPIVPEIYSTSYPNTIESLID